MSVVGSDKDRAALDLFLAVARRPGSKGVVFERSLSDSSIANFEPAIARIQFARLEKRGFLIKKRDPVEERNPRYKRNPLLPDSNLSRLAGLLDPNGEPEFIKVSGEPYWELTEAGLSYWQGAPDPIGIPASDRFVTLDHNQPEVQAARAAVNDLVERVEGANDLFANDEDRLVAIREVKSLRDALAAPRQRLAALWQATQESSVISFIAREAAGGVVGEVALKVLAAVAALIAIFG